MRLAILGLKPKQKGCKLRLKTVSHLSRKMSVILDRSRQKLEVALAKHAQ